MKVQCILYSTHPSPMSYVTLSPCSPVSIRFPASNTLQALCYETLPNLHLFALYFETKYTLFFDALDPILSSPPYNFHFHCVICASFFNNHQAHSTTFVFIGTDTGPLYSNPFPPYHSLPSYDSILPSLYLFLCRSKANFLFVVHQEDPVGGSINEKQNARERVRVLSASNTRAGHGYRCFEIVSSTRS
jgi:hypothetical protein